MSPSDSAHSELDLFWLEPQIEELRRARTLGRFLIVC